MWAQPTCTHIRVCMYVCLLLSQCVESPTLMLTPSIGAPRLTLNLALIPLPSLSPSKNLKPACHGAMPIHTQLPHATQPPTITPSYLHPSTNQEHTCITPPSCLKLVAPTTGGAIEAHIWSHHTCTHIRVCMCECLWLPQGVESPTPMVPHPRGAATLTLNLAPLPSLPLPQFPLGRTSGQCLPMVSA